MAFVVLICFFVTGCASQYGRQTTPVAYYPECYAPIAKLRQEEKQFVHNVAAGAIVGAVAGAIIGGMIGGGRGAAIGAGVGLVGGAGMAAFLTKYRQIQDDKQRRMTLSSDLATEAATLDSVGLSAAMASKCYKEQFDVLLASFKAGQMSKEEFRTRSMEIISGLNEIAAITKNFNAEAARRIDQYQTALADEAKKENTALPPLQAVSLKKPVQARPVPEAEPKAKASKKGKSGTKQKKDAEATEAEPAKSDVKNPLALAQPKSELASLPSGPKPAETRTPGDSGARVLPGVVAPRDNQGVNAGAGEIRQATVLQDGPDPATLPGVVAQRDNYQASVQELGTVQQATASTAANCIAQAEAAGVDIPQSLKPRATSSETTSSPS